MPHMGGELKTLSHPDAFLSLPHTRNVMLFRYGNPQRGRYAAGGKGLKSWIKFKKLLHAVIHEHFYYYYYYLPLFSFFFEVFLNAGKTLWDEGRKGTVWTQLSGSSSDFFGYVKGRIWGEENAGSCFGRREAWLARQRPYGIGTKHTLDLVHLIPLCVKDTFRSKAKKYSFDYYCFQTCRDFSK